MKKLLSIAVLMLVSSNSFAAKAQSSNMQRSMSYKAQHSVAAESAITSSGVFSDAVLKKAAGVTTSKLLSIEAIGGMSGINIASF